MGYRPGNWLAVCDRCGFEFYASQLHREWTGLMVCSKDLDHRHPQEFVRGMRDNQTVPWSRPEGPDRFLQPNEVAYNMGFSNGFDDGFGGEHQPSELTGAQAVHFQSFSDDFDLSYEGGGDRENSSDYSPNTPNRLNEFSNEFDRSFG